MKAWLFVFIVYLKEMDTGQKPTLVGQEVKSRAALGLEAQLWESSQGQEMAAEFISPSLAFF